MKLPPNPPAIRTLRDEELTRLKGLYPDLPHSLKGCKTCRGTGTFQWKDPSYETGPGLPPWRAIEWECNCVEQFVLHRYLLNAGVELSYQRLSWVDAAGAEQGAQDVVLEYVDHADQYAGMGLGLMLHGRRGTGKTMLTTLLLKMLLAKGLDAYFVTFQDLIDIYVSGWRNETERAWFDRRIRNAGVLGIDDVGRENKARVEMVESMFDHVIRPRVAAARPTIITTNKSLDELRSLYRGNVMSLLTESCIEYEFSGEDYRETAKVNRIAEARGGLTRPLTLA